MKSNREFTGDGAISSAMPTAEAESRGIELHDPESSEVATCRYDAAGHATDACQWSELIEGSGLTADQLTYATNRLAGIQQTRIAEALGWAPAKAERIRKQLYRRLHPPPRRALANAHHDDAIQSPPLPARPLPGRRIEHLFFALEAVSHSQLSKRPKPAYYRGPILMEKKPQPAVPAPSLADLQARFDSAYRYQDTLADSRAALLDLTKSLQREVTAATFRADAERVAAHAENRLERQDVMRAVIPMQSRLISAQDQLATATESLTKQQTLVARLAHEIEMTQVRAVQVANAKDVQELCELQDRAAIVSDRILARCEGSAITLDQMFPETPANVLQFRHRLMHEARAFKTVLATKKVVA